MGHTIFVYDDGYVGGRQAVAAITSRSLPDFAKVSPRPQALSHYLTAKKIAGSCVGLNEKRHAYYLIVARHLWPLIM